MEVKVLVEPFLSTTTAATALGRLLSFPVMVARGQRLIAEAWTYRSNLIVDDAVYVALAKHLGAPVLTGDRKMAGAPNLPVQVLRIS